MDLGSAPAGPRQHDHPIGPARHDRGLGRRDQRRRLSGTTATASACRSSPACGGWGWPPCPRRRRTSTSGCTRWAAAPRAASAPTSRRRTGCRGARITSWSISTRPPAGPSTSACSTPAAPRRPTPAQAAGSIILSGSAGNFGPYTLAANQIIALYEMYLPVGMYRLRLDAQSGTADLGLSLHRRTTRTSASRRWSPLPGPPSAAPTRRSSSTSPSPGGTASRSGRWPPPICRSPAPIG